MKLCEGTLAQVAKSNADSIRRPQHRIVCHGFDLQKAPRLRILNVEHSLSGTCLTVLEITKRPAGCYSLKTNVLITQLEFKC